MGFDIRVKQYWELLKILKMFTITSSVVAKLKLIENGVLNVKLNIFHNRKLSSNLHDHVCEFKYHDENNTQAGRQSLKMSYGF